jgi:predicted nucleic acid-binding protein
MAQEKYARELIIDTYAIISDLMGTISPAASKALDLIRLGEVIGVVHYLIIYELTYFWKKGGLIFKSSEEIKEFIETYFKVAELDTDLALEAAKVKAEGDQLLRKASELKLRRRRLSVADATTLALALRFGAPLVTGDEDLRYVADCMRVEVIW